MSTLPLDEVPLDRLLWINQVCNRFEQALRDGTAGRPEDYLADGPPEVQQAALAELQALAQAWQEEMIPPRQLGEYEIVGLLGRGGMGRVYRAVHRLMRRTVALKILASKGPTLEQR